MSITPQEFAEQTRQKLLEIARNNRPLQLAATSTHATISRRAFTDGRNEDGQQFQYSGTPLYVNPDSPSVRRKFPPLGKPNAEGKRRKGRTGWFNGYGAFKQSQGYSGAYVNWQLTGDLKSDYENQPVGAPSDTALPFRVDVNEYQGRLKRPENTEKYEGLASRFGEFLTASETEKRQFYRIVENELADILNP